MEKKYLYKPYTSREFSNFYSKFLGLELKEDDEKIWFEEFTKSLEESKTDKLSEIKQAFNQEQEDGHIVSSLGFEVDATRRSKDDIESLLYVDEFPVRFRDYNNEFHNLEKEQVEVLKREIIAYGLANYQKKWTLEGTIKNATTIEEVEAVLWEM